MKISPATPDQHEALTALTIRSKAYWDYPPEQLEDWHDDLTVTQEMITQNLTHCLTVNDMLVGYLLVHPPEEGELYLENLFIDPPHIGKGYGKVLLDYSYELAQAHHCKSIRLLADPHSASFYEKHGFETYDQFQSSIPGRFLPMMRKKLQ